MRDDGQTVKIELLSQWKLEAEFCNNTINVINNTINTMIQ